MIVVVVRNILPGRGEVGAGFKLVGASHSVVRFYLTTFRYKTAPFLMTSF